MKISLNSEYARNHLFVVVLMAALAGWFGYDGFVRYPATGAAELYERIERSAPGPGWSPEALEAFKTQKIRTQYGFCALALLAAAVVGLRLLASARFRFDYDETGFSVGGERHLYSDISGADDRDWEKKGICRLDVGGRKVVLDAWHHRGVKEFHDKFITPIDGEKKI